MWGFSPKSGLSFDLRSKEVGVFAEKRVILRPEVEGSGGGGNKRVGKNG